MDHLRIAVEPGPPLRLRVAGEIDLASSAELVTLTFAEAPGDCVFVLDLGAVTFFDASAARALLLLERRFGDRLVIVPNDRVRRVLDALGLGGAFRLEDAPGRICTRGW